MIRPLGDAHLSDPCSFPRWARKADPSSMPLDMSMMYSAVRICGTKTLEDGSLRQGANGTGFVVMIPSKKIGDLSYSYVVTAHHVIAPLSGIYIEFANPSQAGALYPAQPLADWRRPKDERIDLAFAPVSIPTGQTAIGLPFNSMVIYGLEPTLGALIYYVGLLAPLNIPMARSGTLGALDVAGIEHDRGYVYDAHLVDVRSYGGFSGSPCYFEYPLANLTPLDLTELPVKLPPGNQGPKGSLGFLHLLAGMFTEHYEVKGRPPSSLGLGVILPADTIVEALMSDDLRKEREDMDDAHLAREPDARPRAASVPEQADELARFEDLTSKLLRVPKSEIDEQRKGKGA